MKGDDAMLGAVDEIQTVKTQRLNKEDTLITGIVRLIRMIGSDQKKGGSICGLRKFDFLLSMPVNGFHTVLQEDDLMFSITAPCPC